jgi:2Fe-2S ferredoxin
MISFSIQDSNNEQHPLEIPEGSGFSLMEILRAAGYPIAATCGGMALCATCLLEVVEGNSRLPQPGDAEDEMLDTLPLTIGDFRLSCQLRADELLNGCVFRFPAP